MIQLILHLIGDYVTQSDWMANEKTKRHFPALAHALIYSVPFLFLRPSWLALGIIFGTHFLIDRYRLARVVVFLKEAWLRPYFWRQPIAWEEHNQTGYRNDKPAWLAVWLLIAADNTMHLTINWLCLRFL